MRVFSQNILIALLFCLQGCFSSSSPENQNSSGGQIGGTGPVPSLSVEAQEIEALKLSMNDSGVAISTDDFVQVVDSVELTDEERELLIQLQQ